MGDHGHNRHALKRGRLLCPFHEGAGSRSNTMWPGPRSTFIPSSIFIHPAVWSELTWAENWVGGGLCPFLGEAKSPSNTKSPGPRPTSIPSCISVHPAVWPRRIWAENWGAVPLGRGGAGSPSITSRLGRGLPPYQAVSRCIQPFGHNKYWPEIGGCGKGSMVPI